MSVGGPWSARPADQRDVYVLDRAGHESGMISFALPASAPSGEYPAALVAAVVDALNLHSASRPDQTKQIRCQLAGWSSSHAYDAERAILHELCGGDPDVETRVREAWAEIAENGARYPTPSEVADLQRRATRWALAAGVDPDVVAGGPTLQGRAARRAAEVVERSDQQQQVDQ